MFVELSERAQSLRKQVKEFMDTHITPNEGVWHAQIAEGDRWQPTAIVEELKEKAKAAGLWNLFCPRVSMEPVSRITSMRISAS